MITDQSDLSSLENVLAQAVRRAGVTGRVELRETSDGETLLELTPLSRTRVPFSPNPEEATAWLQSEDVDAVACYDDDGYLVISPRSKDGVHRLVERWLGPFIYAESVGEQLRGALAQHELDGEVAVLDACSVDLVIQDSDNLATAVQLGTVLGAGDIAKGLKLHRPRGMSKLAGRMRLLLTGVVGHGVGVLAEPGCAHAEDELRLRLTVDQTLRLAGRIAAEPSAVSRETSSANSPLPKISHR
ncbi:hypothetical protein [Streptomyces sp. NPDC059209]|uniref:hypothetical protein n=1 Tax=Streptomyces sp. NPDC059209 TaxID=3346769 RepID=UPI00367A4DC5